ncbi:MAG: hypothetical protein ACRDSF_14720 [Pseudonocardiaceae bacterium]
MIALAACAGPSEPVITIPDGDRRLIGEDLQAGTYRTEGSAVHLFPSCNWKRFRVGGQGLVASGSVTGPTTIVIEPSDGAFESRGCQPWVRQP